MLKALSKVKMISLIKDLLTWYTWTYLDQWELNLLVAKGMVWLLLIIILDGHELDS